MSKDNNRLLVTGAFGFVGRHLIRKLIDTNSYEIYATSRSTPKLNESSVTVFQGDLRNADFVLNVLNETKPSFIINLAAESSVAYSWKHPNDSFQNNVNIFLNLIEAVRKIDFKTRILSVGSSEEYGIVDKLNIPIEESIRPNPISPYAVARLAQSELSKVYSKGFGLDIVSTRSFNHFGSDQSDRFVIPAFVNKVLKQKYSSHHDRIQVGDLSIIRDFLHVDDVVEAYLSLLNLGISGEFYNVCSGTGYSLEEILFHIYDVLEFEPFFEISQEFIRPNDNPVIIGNNQKIIKTTDWLPKKNFKEEIVLMAKGIELKYF